MKSSIVALVLSAISPVLALPTAPAIAVTDVQSRQSSNSVNTLLALITQLFPVNVVIENVDNLIGAAELIFATLAGFDTTEDDINSGKCGDVVVVFARGTAEPGNVGALVGPPFFESLRSKLSAKGKSLAVQGVDNYEASVTGFLQGGEAKGSQRMADLVTKAQKQCPAAKVVMSGYSQGGQLVHNAAKLLPTATMSAVSSIVVFGDPYKGYAIQGASASKVLTICHEGDNICDGGDLILLPHLTYLLDADTAADFVVAHAS